jgi:hypothetical protein
MANFIDITQKPDFGLLNQYKRPTIDFTVEQPDRNQEMLNGLNSILPFTKSTKTPKAEEETTGQVNIPANVNGFKQTADTTETSYLKSLLNKKLPDRFSGLSTIGTIGKNAAGGGDEVVSKLDELIELMKSGGIAVNIDGSKVSTAVGVATKFRGSF